MVRRQGFKRRFICFLSFFDEAGHAAFDFLLDINQWFGR